MTRPRVLEPGLQLERTNLAWSRTGLALVGNGALLLRFARGAHPAVLGYVVGALTLLFGVAAWLFSHVDYPARTEMLLAGRSPLRPGAVRLLHVALVVAAAGSGVTAITVLLGD